MGLARIVHCTSGSVSRADSGLASLRASAGARLFGGGGGPAEVRGTSQGLASGHNVACRA
eukprot:5291494-Alexandrium_andersonii.AAC.1